MSKAKGLLIGLVAFGLSLSYVGTGSSLVEPIGVYALEDNVGQTMNNSQGNMNNGVDTRVPEEDREFANWIKNNRGFSSEQLQVASDTLSPITNVMGYIVGGIISLIFAGLFVITSLDLLYLTIPPIRNLLYKAGTDGTGAYTGGMGAGGFGRMGMGTMGGVGGASGGTSKPTQWISDEAVMCAALIGGSAQSTAGPMGPVGAQPQHVPMKSVIGTYFKKRIFFMILLVVSAIVLTSSILLGTGVNLAQWGIKIISIVNDYIPI